MPKSPSEKRDKQVVAYVTKSIKNALLAERRDPRHGDKMPTESDVIFFILGQWVRTGKGLRDYAEVGRSVPSSTSMAETEQSTTRQARKKGGTP